VVETRDFPNLREGYFASVVGPYATQAEAAEMRDRLSGVAEDAYVKSGW
jgi:hypothetical protein